MRKIWLPCLHPSRQFCLILSLALLAVACSRDEEGTAESFIDRITSPVVEVDVNKIPKLDRTKAIVPAEEILFDTFGGADRVIPLTEVNERMIVRFRDKIPPLYNPEFQAGNTADWMNEEDFIVGYAQDDIAIAYPIKILNWHEIVSHEVDGLPLMVTY